MDATRITIVLCGKTPKEINEGRQAWALAAKQLGVLIHHREYEKNKTRIEDLKRDLTRERSRVQQLNGKLQNAPEAQSGGLAKPLSLARRKVAELEAYMARCESDQAKCTFGPEENKLVQRFDGRYGPEDLPKIIAPTTEFLLHNGSIYGGSLPCLRGLPSRERLVEQIKERKPEFVLLGKPELATFSDGCHAAAKTLIAKTGIEKVVYYSLASAGGTAEIRNLTIHIKKNGLYQPSRTYTKVSASDALVMVLNYCLKGLIEDVGPFLPKD